MAKETSKLCENPIDTCNKHGAQCMVVHTLSGTGCVPLANENTASIVQGVQQY
jgi:hypothetical protein